MTNHHSGPSTAEEICGILPALVGLRTDEVIAIKQHQPAVMRQKADTAERNLPYRNISERLFRHGFGLADNVEIDRTIVSAMRRA